MDDLQASFRALWEPRQVRYGDLLLGWVTDSNLPCIELYLITRVFEVAVGQDGFILQSHHRMHDTSNTRTTLCVAKKCLD